MSSFNFLTMFYNWSTTKNSASFAVLNAVKIKHLINRFILENLLLLTLAQCIIHNLKYVLCGGTS